MSPKQVKNTQDYIQNPSLNSMLLEQIDQQHIIDAANKLKPKTSSGHDDISTKLMKETIQNIILPITHIINRSFASGIFPDQMKRAKVIPIYKSSSQNELKNYRPISLLPAFSKLIEKIMFKKVMSYLDSKNILYKHQYGFRARHSTIHPVILLLNHISEVNNSDPKQLTLSIFCDLSKAFDVINHKILLQKLHHYGFRGIVNDWFASYLSGRTQFVEIESAKSNILEINCAVPQGSILGPLLYLIYVNDIAKSTDGYILSFADDTSMYLSDPNIKNLYSRANIPMNDLFQWFCTNRLSLNPNKTKYIIFRPSHKYLDLTGLECIDNVPLQQIGSNYDEKSTKFLGLNIDESLTWKYHVQNINNKISRSLFSIKQARNFLPLHSLKTLYFSLIQPLLTYGILEWGNANTSIIHKTTMMQKRAIRVINKATYNAHTDPLYKKSGILKLNDQYELQAILFVNDFLSDKLPASFENVFRLNSDVQSAYKIRQSNIVHSGRCDSVNYHFTTFHVYGISIITSSRVIPIHTIQRQG